MLVFYCHYNYPPQTYWLKPTQTLIFKFYKLEVSNESHWAHSKVSAREYCFLEEKQLPCLFCNSLSGAQLSEAIHFPWLVAPSRHPHSRPHCVCTTSLSQSHLPGILTSAGIGSLLLRTRVSSSGPPLQTNLNNLPISSSLMTSANSLYPCKVASSQIPRIRTHTSLWGHYSTYHRV